MRTEKLTIFSLNAYCLLGATVSNKNVSIYLEKYINQTSINFGNKKIISHTMVFFVNWSGR
ncbi:hypothetical protein ACJX0J_026784, partial [Zea mays]